MRIVLILLLISWSVPASATNAGELLKYCKLVRDKPDSVDPKVVLLQGFCYGFVQAVVSTQSAFAVVATTRNTLICAPEQSTIHTTIDALVAHLKAHPELHSENAGAVALNSLVEIYPCKPRN
jgi:hypothetical protein